MRDVHSCYHNFLVKAVGKSADPDQTAQWEQSDLGLNFFSERYMSIYLGNIQ